MKNLNIKKFWILTKKYKKIITLSILTIITTIILLTISLKINDIWKRKTVKQITKEEWLTIFTHGSFGSILGLLNVFDVLKDKTSGTSYKKIISKMRKDPHFYCNQPMLQRGLIKIKPSFDLSITSSNKYIVYPLSKAYETILEQVNPEKEKNSFYTFGWSGLFSQQRRRIEAIRFYNNIVEELEKYEKKGIKPKIRILTHSHGGNLVLNFAAIKTVLNYLEKPEQIENIPKNTDEKESLLSMLKIIKKLPTKDQNKLQKGQKLFDYIPEKKDIKINELIMFGTPIQPETAGFAFNDIFEKVYNFYSDEDVVQDLDGISTKRYSSNKRFNFSNNIKIDKQDLPSKVIQAKIMIRKGFLNKLFSIKTDFNEKEKDKKQGFWSKILSGIFSSKKNDDPTHRELWFILWDKQNSLNFLPTVVFTPLLTKAIEKLLDQTNDIDLNIKFTKRKLLLYALKHNDTKIKNKISLPMKILEDIKPKILKWKPENYSYDTEFNIIKRYSNFLK
ncbi:hypothetical protein KAT08_00355 [Candidatus Babeliales bacterium]|nr:hypothetical protein [Candidatus Babeliales bacterium]